MKTNLKHGPGAAHIGFSMFGARGPLLAPEDTGAGASASTGDAPNTTVSATATTTGEPATSPGAASEKMLPQSKVSTLIAEAKREAKEAARREFEAAQQQAAPKKDPPKDQASFTQSDFEKAIKREREIERGIAGLKPAQAARLEETVRAVNPADIAAYCKSYRDDMGFDTAAVPAQPAVATTPEVRPAPAAAPAAPSAHTLPTAHGVTDLFSLTPAQIQAQTPASARKALEELWKIGNQMSGAPDRPKVPQR